MLLLEEDNEEDDRVLTAAASAGDCCGCCCWWWWWWFGIVVMVGSWSREMECEMDSRNVISWSRRKIDDGGCRMMFRLGFRFCFCLEEVGCVVGCRCYLRYSILFCGMESGSYETVQIKRY